MKVKQVFETVALIVIGVCIAFRLPKNGWSSFVWYAGLLSVYFVRTPHMMRYDAEKIVDTRVTTIDRIVMVSAITFTSLLPALHLSTGLFMFAKYAQPDWAIIVGTIFVIASVWLMKRSHADLDLNWSPTMELRAEHTLVTTGVYSSVRHPMYAGFILYAASQPLLVPNFIAGAIAPLSMVALYMVRVQKEERMMQDLFGHEYEQYKLSTGSILPKVRYGSL